MEVILKNWGKRVGERCVHNEKEMGKEELMETLQEGGKKRGGDGA